MQNECTITTSKMSSKTGRLTDIGTATEAQK
jgi:hypothetical protein